MNAKEKKWHGNPARMFGNRGKSRVGPGRKVLSLNVLAREIRAQKRLGRRIGFTNGCFDCCHLGHLASLYQAKSLCDVLVVGVNSDEWIRANKGVGRPIQDEKTRSMLIASMECVDFVVVFGEQTALPIVQKIRPHVIAKEGYALADWPEGRFVLSYGGDAVTLRRLDGYSTTSLAAKRERAKGGANQAPWREEGGLSFR